MEKMDLIEFQIDFVSESDRNLGDYVLVFPNPDHPKYEQQYCKLSDCFLVLENCFKFEDDQKSRILKECFSEAFLDVYNKLEKIDTKIKKEKNCKPFSEYTENIKVSQKKIDDYEKLDLKPLMKKKVWGGKYLQPVI